MTGTQTESQTASETPSPREPEPTRTLLILGASGDLTGRLLLPGLAQLLATGRHPELALVGAGHEPWTPEQWSGRVHAATEAALGPATQEGRETLERLRAESEYRHADVTAPGVLAELIGSLAPPIAVYFALPPRVSIAACALLEHDALPPGTRLVFEKPFGTSAGSAAEFNEHLRRLVPEQQIFRVDHFLGKGTVLNILGLRFANRILEPVWNRDHIEKVEIVFDEDLALEGRAGYYDGAGALRDMVQSHLLHVLALLAMDVPAALHERDLRDAVSTVLRAARIPLPYPETTRRARYTAGTMKGRNVPDYAAEPGVDPGRGTETLAEVTVEVDSWRWAGVPFVLRSGKGMGAKRKEAVVTFRPVPHLPRGFRGMDTPTRLRVGFGPDTLRLDVDVNGPGDVLTLNRVTLDADLNAPDLLPYGEVLDGVLSGDPLLSVRGDTAEDCWRVVEPVLEAWAKGEVPLEEYAAGGTGPAGWATSRRDPA